MEAVWREKTLNLSPILLPRRTAIPSRESFRRTSAPGRQQDRGNTGIRL